MAEYTPDTDEVRDLYDLARLAHEGEKDGDLEFDRWLNQVKAEAQRELLSRLAQEGQHRIKGNLLDEAEEWISKEAA